MPFDYWDIDEILAEQQEVTVKAACNVPAGGVLYSDSGVNQKDLVANDKVRIPLWLAKKMVQRKVADLEMPNMFNLSSQEDLQRDPCVCRLCDRSPYYFEVGAQVAGLLDDVAMGENLRISLFNGMLARWKELVNLNGSLGVTRTQFSPLHQWLALFPQTLTDKESAMLQGGRETEKQFKEWTERFASFVMQPSLIADRPAKVARRSF